MTDTYRVPQGILRRTWYIASPALLLLVSFCMLLLGQYLWNYRYNVDIADPTGRHVNTVISASILIPAFLGLALSFGILCHRLIKLGSVPVA